MASLTSSSSFSPLAKKNFAGKSRGDKKRARCRTVVVRAAKDESESPSVDAPESSLAAGSTKVRKGKPPQSSWGSAKPGFRSTTAWENSLLTTPLILKRKRN